jgi:hypothetical protein
LNEYDYCPYGQIGWSSTIFNDWDGDGCLDAYEDEDDDNDAYADAFDLCPRSEQSLVPVIDLDNDGCDDLLEDYDLDNDGIPSLQDNCENNPLTLFKSTDENDHDSDGCEDSLEDLDDDEDGIYDENDQCVLSPMISFRPDLDNDGCIDTIEDEDNDGDGVINEKDYCPNGETGWISSKLLDSDGDGCRDATEDDNVTSNIFNFFRNNPPLLILFLTLLAISLGVTLSRSGYFGYERQSIHSPTEAHIREEEKEDKLWNDVENQIDSILQLDKDSESNSKIKTIKKPQKVKPKKSVKVVKSESKTGSWITEEVDLKTLDSEDAASWLKLADELEKQGKVTAAKECRKTAMNLLLK